MSFTITFEIVTNNLENVLGLAKEMGATVSHSPLKPPPEEQDPHITIHATFNKAGADNELYAYMFMSLVYLKPCFTVKRG